MTPYSPPRSVRALPSRELARSLPAENTVDVPVMIPTQSSGSSSSRSRAAPMPSAIAWSTALRFSSRSMRTIKHASSDFRR